MDISETMIRNMLFRPKFPFPKFAPEFHNKVRQMRELTVMRDPERRAGLMRYVVNLIVEQGFEPA